MKFTDTLKTSRFRSVSTIAFTLLARLTPSTRAEVPSDPTGQYAISWLGGEAARNTNPMSDAAYRMTVRKRSNRQQVILFENAREWMGCVH